MSGLSKALEDFFDRRNSTGGIKNNRLYRKREISKHVRELDNYTELGLVFSGTKRGVNRREWREFNNYRYVIDKRRRMIE